MFKLRERIARLKVRLAKRQAEGKSGRVLIDRIETLEGYRDERFPIVLRVGDKGPRVEALQRRLNRWVKRKGRTTRTLIDPWTEDSIRMRVIKVDGVYGKATEDMVTAYELETGRLPDGKVSRAMLRTLDVAALAKQIRKSKKALAKRSRILSREQWGADPRSVGRFGEMPGPVGEVNLHHSVTTRPGASLASFKQAVKRIEGIGLARFGIFSYSFVAARGRVAEGCGWKYVGAHTGGRNSSSYGYCFIGNYEHDKLVDADIFTFGRTMKRGKSLTVVKRGADIDLHRDHAPTACPGRDVVNNARKLRAAA